MVGKCSHPGCFDPDNMGCNVEGHIRLTDCPNYNKDESNNGDKQLNEDEYYRIPWTGNSFGIVDLNHLTASVKPILIGVAGAASAGKTTFLASLYCLLRHGKKIGGYSFSGSLTLIGWENIAWYLSWKSNSEIQFPPHTSNNSGRVPGLLHLALKNKDGDKIDLLFTDAPGEWFDYWRNNADGENARGAKWIHENCNAFLLFADCEMLAGKKRGSAKLQINSIADRLFENIDDRPLELIWSKSDIAITQTTKSQILSHIELNKYLHFTEFEASVKEGEKGCYHNNICESINWILCKLNGNTNDNPIIDSLKPDDLFLSKRSINE